MPDQPRQLRWHSKKEKTHASLPDLTIFQNDTDLRNEILSVVETHDMRIMAFIKDAETLSYKRIAFRCDSCDSTFFIGVDQITDLKFHKPKPRDSE
ncbi:MAG TPA: hypothetical protein VN739_08845 [Nitrososphaerales archaeon]|nr:hypothetical protein [Nitrososphaerales archaeon]